jgi:hypothetical protein
MGCGQNMSKRFISEKWNEYNETLREDLSETTLDEARDAFYAGVIAVMAIMGATKGQAAQAIEEECKKYLQMMEERAKQPNQWR